MEVETSLATGLKVTHGNEDYDAACKRLLAEKPILARILKSCVREFRDFDVDVIANRCIEGAPFISNIPVEPDATGAVIRGLTNEISSLTEGTVRFDIYFDAVVPNKDETIQLIINVEAQNKFNPGYPLLKRAVYFCSRIISSQYGKIFEHQHYEKIRKVYSIWICTNPLVSWKNTINQYSIIENNIVGCAREDIKNYDLITIVTICIGDKNDDKCKDILAFLHILLSKNESIEEKQKIISRDCNIKLTKSINKELLTMCNLSQGIYEEGFEAGKLAQQEKNKDVERRLEISEQQREIAEQQKEIAEQQKEIAEQHISNIIKKLQNKGYSNEELSNLFEFTDEQLKNIQ